MDDLLEVKAGESVLHGRLDWLGHALEYLATGLEVFAILVMLVGVVRYAIGFFAAETSATHDTRVERLHVARVDLGRYVLAGLELFIVADLIHIALSLKLSDLLFLSLLVVIRTIISYFLDREVRELKRDLKNDEVI